MVTPSRRSRISLERELFRLDKTAGELAGKGLPIVAPKPSSMRHGTMRNSGVPTYAMTESVRLEAA